MLLFQLPLWSQNAVLHRGSAGGDSGRTIPRGPSSAGPQSIQDPPQVSNVPISITSNTSNDVLASISSTVREFSSSFSLIPGNQEVSIRTPQLESDHS